MKDGGAAGREARRPFASPASASGLRRPALPGRLSRVHRIRPTRASLALRAVLTVFALVALVSGCGGDPSRPATTATPTDPGLSPEPAPSGTPVVADDGIRYVYLLGGSSARECVISNAAWSDQLTRLFGREVRAVDLGETNQTYTADIAYVRGMAERPTTVLIGLGLTRYTWPVTPGRADKPLSTQRKQALAGAFDVEHRYDEKGPLSSGEKEDLLALWLDERYPMFRRSYDGNLDELERLIEACEQRGFAAMLVDLPLNVAIIGDKLDTPRGKYLEDARRLAVKHQIPFIAFVDDLGLADADFYDLMHVLDSGRPAWQARMTREVVAAMKAAGEVD